MRGIYLAAILVAAVVPACDGAVGQAIEACTVFCECEEAPVDSIQQQCVDQCVAESVNFIDQLPPDCFTCIAEHRNRCLSLEIECEPVCDIDDDPVPPPEPGPVDPPVSVDAGFPPDAF